MRILIVEDERECALTECDYLTANGFHCDIAEDGEKGLQFALSGDYALVILDVTLPKRDGFSVCNEIRKEKDVPILFVSEQCEEIDVIRGFTLGADDYISKPFSPAELVARVKGHIKRYEILSNKPIIAARNVIVVRNLKIDKDAHRVFLGENEIFMPVREFELLLFLAENPNIVFSKERLFDRLWGMDALSDDSTVTVHIQRIRDKIEKCAEGEKFIETVWGAGYRFCG